jgi:thiamine biosynthesis lipoprotein
MKIQDKISNLLFVLFCFTTVSCSGDKTHNYVTSEGEMLGTFMKVTAQTDKAVVEIYDAMQALDTEAKASMSIFDENSLLSRINRNETDSLDRHILRCLNLARRVTEQSDGFYDITVAPLVEAYGFAGKQRKAEIKVDSIMEFVGMDKLQVEGNRLIKSDKRVRVDLNSIAKGYVVDLATERLAQMGVEDYLVDIGGEVRCSGRNPKGGAWRIGIETPIDGNAAVGASIQQIISLSDCAMATSGNYRRFYLNDKGEKVAHTIDPRTGQSAVTNLLSATVIAPTCAEADAYGTMFMAMGTERAVEVARILQPQGVMVYFIAAGEGDGYKVYYSHSLAPMLNTTEGFIAIK